MTDNKIIIEAILNIREYDSLSAREMAAVMELPKNNQKDLMYLSAILVSTGTNKNGAHFLGNELVKARETINQKPVTIEHVDDDIVGHIVSRMYFDNAGNVIDDEKLAKECSSSPEKDKEIASMAMDIGIICAVYKDRFPKIAEEIAKGDWKVSMECYYDNYDIKIGNLIIPRSEASNYNIDDNLNIMLENKVRAFYKAARVLKNIKFCGVSIVKNPANEKSIIMEAASENIRQIAEREQFRMELKAAASLNMKEAVDETKTEVIQTSAKEYFVVKNGTEIVPNSSNFNYFKVLKDAIKLTASTDGDVYTVGSSLSKFFKRNNIELNETSEATSYSVSDDGSIEQINEFSSDFEKAHLVSRWGPKENPAGLCASFEKYVREFPGTNMSGRIIATHWCKLFNAACPVLGAMATDTACLRNKFARLVKVDDGIRGEIVNPQTFNPQSNTPAKEVVVLKAEDMPLPKADKSKIDELKQSVDVNSGIKLDKRTPITPIAEVKADVVDVPLNPLPAKKSIPFTNPYAEFPLKVSKVSASERKELPETSFGLPRKRMYPIHTKERIIAMMGLFPQLKEKLTSFRDKKELFNNLVRAAVKEGIDTEHFEKTVTEFRFKTTKSQSSEDFGLPRLKLFPLNNREQVIAAISRFDHLKVEMSDHEKENLVINILRAAKRFDINAGSFRDRIFNNK